MSFRLSVVLMAMVLAGCSEYGYRYQPHPQALYSPVFADYRAQDDGVEILVDTDGLRLNEVQVVKPDGSVVKPTGIDYPPFQAETMRGAQEEIYGPALANGPTVAHFARDAIGPGPWDVRLDIQAMPTTTIRVGPEPAATRP